MKLYNTLTRTKEEFVPIHDKKVGIYSCGPTVYNYFHIGNARPFIVFDILRNYLEYRGYDVTFVQNFTDIDDKIIDKAKTDGKDPLAISQHYIDEYFIDAQGLGIRPATHHPRVSEVMDDIIAFIEGLIEKGYAYQVNGTVYYDTEEFPNYGKLSGQNMEELELGARIDVDYEKKNPIDFVLWKPKKEGEIAWESPWGEGRPGWHIECSVMSRKYLGDSLDIHSGGQDLIFPHHENEIAQSEALTGKTFSKYWVHNGYININNQKMSKSLNNFFTVRDISKEIDLEVVRFFLLNAQYRNPVNFSKELLESSKTALDRLYTCKFYLERLIQGEKEEAEKTADESSGFAMVAEFKQKYLDAMDDDLNTAGAIGVLFEFVKWINTSIDETSPKSLMQSAYDMFCELTKVLNIVQKTEEQRNVLDIDTNVIDRLIEERSAAKKNKNFARADEIRDQLDDMGIVIHDTRQGTTWEKK